MPPAFQGPDHPGVLLLLLLSIAIVVGSSCGPTRNHQLQTQVEKYRVRLDEISRAVDALQSNLSELDMSVSTVRSAIDNFDERDWRPSLEEIDEATARVESDLEDVQAAADDIESKARWAGEQYLTARRTLHAPTPRQTGAWPRPF